MIRVSLVRGGNRYENVARALDLIRDQVNIADKPVLLKPNFVSTRNPLAATHVDAARAALAFLRDIGAGEVIVAAGPAIGTADEGFRNYGYLPLADEFNVRFMDLNTDETVPAASFDSNLNPQTLRMSKTVAESYVVSVCPMKTHNDVVVTLGLKNVLVGALAGVSQKQGIHRGSKAINLTLAKMAQSVGPDLTVIDGTVGMQGNGPVDGYAIDSRMVVASADRIAADVVGLQVMGFELSQVGYLRYCMELRNLAPEDIEIVGESIEACRTRFEPHSNIASQLSWQVDGDWRAIFDAAT